MATTDTSLISFRAIASFVDDLSQIFSKNQRSLKLYSHLLQRTSLCHEKAIEKHLAIFRNFCVSNRDGITSNDETKFTVFKVKYSKNAYIDFQHIFRIADAETKSVIWKHFLTLSALLDPTGNAKNILKQNAKNGKNQNENNFLSDIISKVEKEVDPNSNPTEAISSIMQSGIFTDLIGSMNNGLQDGSLNLQNLMGSVQQMVSSLGEQSGDSSDSNEAMNLINNMMGSLNNMNDNSSSPDIMSMMGPLLSGLNMPSNNTLSIEEKVEEELKASRK